MTEAGILAQGVELKAIAPFASGELSDKFHFDCQFCGKHVVLGNDLTDMHRQLQDRDFYCNFCLRHRFYAKHNRHILMLTLRAIPAYYYYVYYCKSGPGTEPQKMYYAEIQAYIESHAQIGLANPLFSYDPDTFVWFVDFTRVGKGRGKLEVAEIQNTVANLLVCFNLPQHFANIRMYDVAKRFREAIDLFYSQRSRPEGKRLLVPTLSGCGVYENHQGFTMESTRVFTSDNFVRND